MTLKEGFSESQIKQIHFLVLKKIDQKNAGVYRNENVFIAGAKHTPPDYVLVPHQMKDLLICYQKEWKSLHPLERASLLHIEFVKIHPVVDGNGRTSRLLQNFELIKHGFPPLVIKKEQRMSYYKALDKAHATGEAEDFIKLSSDCLMESLDLYLKTIKKDDNEGNFDSSGRFKKIKEKSKTQKENKIYKGIIKEQAKASKKTEIKQQDKNQEKNSPYIKSKNKQKLKSKLELSFNL